MIITEKIRPHRVVRGTWRSAVSSVLASAGAYVLNATVLEKHFQFPDVIPSILGAALAFFIGFNNNQAYDRWWEARTIWGGIVNESRNWARLCLHTVSTSGANDPRVVRLVRRQLAFVYALKEALRATRHETWRDFLDDDDATFIAAADNRHNAVLSLQAKDLHTLHDAGAINGFQFTELSRSLSTLCNEMGRCERIKNTVFPTTYNYYTHAFTMLLVASTTIIIGQNIGPWAVAFGFLVGYVFLTIHAIGRGLLNPFEPVLTGVPVDQISRTIERNLLEMLGENDLPTPIASVKGEYIM